MAQPAQIERRNKGMADSLIDGHRSPRKESSTSCFPYCSLGKRWKEAQPDAGLPTKTYCNRKEASIPRKKPYNGNVILSVRQMAAWA